MLSHSHLERYNWQENQNFLFLFVLENRAVIKMFIVSIHNVHSESIFGNKFIFNDVICTIMNALIVAFVVVSFFDKANNTNSKTNG